jgi:parvulin-like peptidyl-prolyl isomerase
LKKLLSLVAVTALVVTACGSGSTTAVATVDGTNISLAQVESLFVSEESIIPKEQFAQFLAFQIQWNIVEDAAAEQYDIEITEGEIDTEADRIYDTQSAGESREEFTASRGVTETFLRNIAMQSLLDAAVGSELSGDPEPPSQEAIDAEMEVAAASFTSVCVSHILVPTVEESQDVVDRLDAGEDFGEIAGEVSQDPGSGAEGGVLPCGSAGQYVPEFRDAVLIAPVGEVYSEVVESQFGFHIMMVTERTDPAPEDLPTEAEVVDSLTAAAAVALAGELINVWFNDQVLAADVVVDEDYGTWSTDPIGVTPPAA